MILKASAENGCGVVGLAHDVLVLLEGLWPSSGGTSSGHGR